MANDAWSAVDNQFYSNYYCKPTVQLDNVGPALSDRDFIERVAENPILGDNNNLSFLVGEVGSGKTAFINYLITVHGEAVFSNKTMFVRFNANKITEKKLSFDVKSFLYLLCDEVLGKLEKIAKLCEASEASMALADVSSELVREAMRELNDIKKTSDSSQMRKALERCFKAIKENLDCDLYLIFDNIDAAFHQDDRSIAIDISSPKRAKETEAIHDIIYEFQHSPFGLARLSANVMFVLRPESYDMLERTANFYRGTENPYADRAAYYTLSYPNPQEVIQNRILLLQKCVEAIPEEGKRNAIKTHFAPFYSIVEEQLQPRQKKTVDALLSISREGFRDIIAYFQTNAWISSWAADGAQPIQFERYLDQKAIGLIAYILGGKLRFSQFRSGFPNLFLNDAQATGKRRLAMWDDGRARRKPTTHKHTYWLKYFILSYIYTRPTIRVDLVDLVNVFCNGPIGPRERIAEQEGYYSEVLTRVVASSLCHRSQQSCLLPKMDVDDEYLFISDFRITKRGETLIRDFCWKFAYLQNVVDDDYLAFAGNGAPLFERFRYRDGIDYRYLAGRHTEFNNGALAMVKYKMYRVTEFVAILASELEREKSIFSGALASLQEKGIKMPDMKRVFDGIVGEVEALNHFLHIMDSREIRAKMEKRFVDTRRLYDELLTRES